uniref:Uncharacterized protein n=1 Tax=Rhizophora mucronata TaxID=61149 RepID=A0A2P2Q3A1_RHIMU
MHCFTHLMTLLHCFQTFCWRAYRVSACQKDLCLVFSFLAIELFLRLGYSPNLPASLFGLIIVLLWWQM